MATSRDAVDINIPALPAKHDQFIEYVKTHRKVPMLDLLGPYKQYDAELRKVFAQQPDHPAAKEPNIVQVFAGHEQDVKVRARDVEAESDKEKDCYIMPLKDEDRKPDGSPAIVQSLRDFKTNFNIFSESSLVDLDWTNVVVAGSAVVTSLLAVPEKHGGSKRTLRQFYHEQLAPASDVDLFLYGLTTEQAVEKIKQIERNIRDALLVETTTIRTKNAITIASRHPTRHVQIVLRIYKSISEILTGFDVDCSCAAYDGSQVYASPRALVAYMTQINSIDLTRRSPSYENRLSKYAHRGFEVYWPNLDRSRVDPTIFERTFTRTEGLARLLILEKLPKSEDRDAYLDQRRAERGRPAIDRWRMRRRLVRGNIKDNHEDEVAEWVDEDMSDYHTFTIPYGPDFHARKIEKLLYTKDLLLNSEWNKPKDREVNLHRHPAFFGTVEDVIHDCCGYCPKPTTVEEEEVAEEENKIYISGDIEFIELDPGRQTIGSFNPITTDDWTTMAYVGNTARLCQAIVDGDLEYVQSWLEQEGNDPNTRDYTGRAPLHLAVANSTPEIVQALIDGGARMVARLVDGRTALHLAAMRGSVEMVSALLRKSEANEEEEEKKVDARRAARKAAKKEGTPGDVSMQEADRTKIGSAGAEEDSDVEMIEDADDDEDMDATTENSMINIKSPAPESADKALANEESEDDPDVYDVNVTAWDTAVSPLHLAIVKGHVDVVKCLVQDFGADVLLPIKLFNEHDKSARAAILTLVLALQLPTAKAEEMARTLIQLGASSAQASMDQSTALQFYVADRPDLLDTLANADATGVKRAINHLSVSGYKWSVSVTSPFMTAIEAKDSLTAIRLLSAGAKPEIDFATYMKAYQTRHDPPKDSKQNKREFEQEHEQPVLSAVKHELPLLAKKLVEEHEVNPNTLTTDGYRVLNDEYSRRYTKGKSLLDKVKKQVKTLRKWEYKANEPEAPTPLRDDSEYLSGFGQDTYAFWSAQKQLHSAKKSYKRDLEGYEGNLERSKDRTGVSEKQEAIDHMINDFEKLETALVERGAKTFKDLHPEVKEPEKRDRHSYHRDSPEQKPFEIEIKFQLGDLTGDAQARYESLFEAAWSGNIKAVKQLTLVSWKDGNKEDQPPCRIDVRDQHNITPFGIAVLNGHFELGTAIMDVAKAQHVSADPDKQQRYGIDPGDSEDEDDGSDDDVQLYSEIVDDEFTIENIGEVSVQVKSRTTPLQLLEWNYPVNDFVKSHAVQGNDARGTGFSYFGPRKSSTTMAGKRTNTGSTKAPSPPHSSEQSSRHIPRPSNLMQLALHNNDSELLTFLLGLGRDYFKVGMSEDALPMKSSYNFRENEFKYALQVGRSHLIAEIIKHTGAGLPLNQLAKKYGIEMKERPKYYQGLSVHGTKRRDWADAGRNTMGYEPIQSQRPPLLSSCYFGSVEGVEWFLSDAPMRCYLEFTEACKDDKRLQQLALVKQGIEGSVERFLNARSHLAIHCCLMGDPTPEAHRLLQYLIQAMPDTIEAKSKDGIRPLQIAFELYREDAARVLIEAGADLTSRDRSGKNLVHSLLTRSFDKMEHVEKLKRMLDLIDARLSPDMFLERSTGSETPLHYWLLHHSRSAGDVAIEVIQTIMHYSGGKDLSQISGEGDTPLHLATKMNNPNFIRIMLEYDPGLLNRENATGRTPFEMAEDGSIAAVCNDPPPMPGDHNFLDRRARRYGYSSCYDQHVLDRSPKSFVEDSGIAPKDDREIVWEILKETKAKLDEEGEVKRRLVSLNEANEVARRLATMKAQTPRYGGESANSEAEDEDDYLGDEVQAYLEAAKNSMK